MEERNYVIPSTSFPDTRPDSPLTPVVKPLKSTKLHKIKLVHVRRESGPLSFILHCSHFTQMTTAEYGKN